jgi:ABC-type dipeptide/oligopeptide/nickel transport system permease component
MFVDPAAVLRQRRLRCRLHLQPITSLLADAVPITLRLTVIAVVFESLVGIFCGVVSALRANGFVDNFIRFSTTLVISVPVFVLGVLVQILTGLYIGVWLTTTERRSGSPPSSR